LPDFNVHLVGHWQLLLHTKCEQESQLPALVAPGLQAPSPEHVPHAQLFEHVCVPQLPQLCLAPGTQIPPPEQVPQVLHVQVLRHDRVCEPQLPQACCSVSPGLQAPWLMQTGASH